MGSNRDNFSKKIIEKLRSRVSNRCSNPDCRVPTTGPTKDPEKVNSIGVAAHISAAAPGGARYDPDLTVKQRKSINNAIWLCSNCSRDIDNNPEKYSKDLLLDWKSKSENLAERELGKKLPDDEYVINSISTVLSGSQPEFLPKVISNAHKATSRSLEKLDSRFNVKTSHFDNTTVFEFLAKEDVNLQMTINPPYVKDFIQKYTNLEDHGEKLVIDSSALTFKGSPLFQRWSHEEKGRIEITSQRVKKATLKVWLVSPCSNSTTSIDDFIGNAVLGKKTVTIRASAFNEIVELKLSYNFNGPDPSQESFTFTTHLQKWDGSNLNFLPYFEKVYDLYRKINEGWEFHVAAEIEGHNLLKACCEDFNKKQSFIYLLRSIEFIHDVKGICRAIGETLIFDSSFPYSSEFHRKIYQTYMALTSGYKIKTSPLNGNAKCTLQANEDLSNIKHIIEKQNKPTTLKIEEHEPETLTIFNKDVEIPCLSHFLTKVSPKIISDISKLSPGDFVEIEWNPIDECEYIIEKKSPTSQ